MFFYRHEKHARLTLQYPQARVVHDTTNKLGIDYYRQSFNAITLTVSPFKAVHHKTQGLHYLSDLISQQQGYIVYPLASAEACAVAAYVMSQCQLVYDLQCWHLTQLTAVQKAWLFKYPVLDMHYWIMYGSWSWCEDCGSFCYNDAYFKEQVYQNQAASNTPDLLSTNRRQVPDDPVEHCPGSVGVSSRWWYLPGMYHPVKYCERCTRPPQGMSAGAFLARSMRQRRQQHEQEDPHRAEPLQRTGQLYRIPRVRNVDSPFRAWSRECVTWPRYAHGEYHTRGQPGECMLELNQDERRALQIVVLMTQVRKENYGGVHQFNWKKTGLSRAYFKAHLVDEVSMPTDRCKAAFRFLMHNNLQDVPGIAGPTY